jgi:methyl-accepting chemotaxis protein
MHKTPFQKAQSNTRVKFLQSWRGRLFILSIIIAVIPMGVLGSIAFLRSQSTLQENTRTSLDKSSRILVDDLNNWLQGDLSYITYLAKDPTVQSMDPTQFVPNLQTGLKEFPDFEFLYVIGTDGKEVYNSFDVNHTIGLKDLHDRAYVIASLKGDTVIGDPVISRTSNHMIIVMSAPIYGKDHKIAGVMAGAVLVKTLNAQMVIGQIGQTGDAYLVSSAGLYLTPSRFDAQLKAAGTVKETTALEIKAENDGVTQALAGKSGVAEYVNPLRGQIVVGDYNPVTIQGTHWALVVEQDTAEAYAGAASLGILFLWIYIGTALIVGLLTLFLTRSLTEPIAAVSRYASRLAQGDINQEVTYQGKDEIGQVADAFRDLIGYMHEMAGAAQRIATGDLTVKVQPRSEADVLGHAFGQMIEKLSSQIGQVSVNARQLLDASSQLADTAHQAENATNQISATIGQVARGSTDQSASITQTAASIDQMKRAIDGVAKGAQEQAEAAGKASLITAQLTSSIQQVANSTQGISKNSKITAEAAKNGAKTVQETVNGMQSIKAKVGLSAQKVQEMGQRSSEIGAIVETIEDIASQTNLLALNAAIEAARAGEHGKGFAVVADEVRKLAERTATATKEIGGLIKGIQHTVAEAVEAMNVSAREVEDGAIRANNAGEALSNILTAVESVYEQVEQAGTAVEKMNKASDELVGAVDSVSAVVEENTAATEQMAASASEVNHSIEAIASVSEENSASFEEVTASADEMNDQVQNVTTATRSLAEMAEALQQIVAEFKFDLQQEETMLIAVSKPDTGHPQVTRPDGSGNGHARRMLQP